MYNIAVFILWAFFIGLLAAEFKMSISCDNNNNMMLILHGNYTCEKSK